jgi:hypothetical protein
MGYSSKQRERIKQQAKNPSGHHARTCAILRELWTGPKTSTQIAEAVNTTSDTVNRAFAIMQAFNIVEIAGYAPAVTKHGGGARAFLWALKIPKGYFNETQ